MSDYETENTIVRFHNCIIHRKSIGDGLKVEVLETIVGEGLGHKFLAVPYKKEGVYNAKSKYCGVGETLQEALIDCMKRTENIPTVQIFHSSEQENLSLAALSFFGEDPQDIH